MMTNGWQTVQLRQVIKLDLTKVPIDADAEYPMVGVYSFGRGLFLREPVSGNKTSYKFFYELKAEHIVMSQLFGWEGALALSSDKFEGLFVSPQFPTFLCDPDQLDRKFLGWIMKQKRFWQDLGSRTKGMGDRRKTLNPEALFSMEIPLPPLPEQHRIVARIDAIAPRINEAQLLHEEASNNLDILHMSIMKAACEGKLETHNANDVSLKDFLMTFGKSPLENSNLPSLPNGWCWVRAEDICDFITKGTTPHAHKLFSGSGEIPFIKVYNLTFDGTLNFSINPTFVSEGTHNGELSRSRLLPGDVLMNIVGPPLGKVSIVPDTFPEWNMNQAIVRFRPLEFCDRNYLSIVLRTASILSRAIELAKGTAGQANLTLEICRNLPIPLPPLDEQRRIVAYLDGLQAKVNALRELQSASGEELSALLPSVLDKAFKGEL